MSSTIRPSSLLTWSSEMGCKYLILGAGKMGEAIAFDLIHRSDSELVAITDKDLKVLKLGQKLEDSSPIECEYFISDIEQMSHVALVDFFRNFGVVISALPAWMSPPLVKASIEAGVNFCDLGGVIDVSNECLEMNKDATRAGVSIVVDCGVQPGLGMIMAKRIMDTDSSVKEIGIYVGGMPQKPRPPVYHQNQFYIGGLKRLCYDPVPILENGQIVYKKAMSETEQIPVSALRKYSRRFEGRVEAFLSAGASVAPWTFGRYGVKIFEKTLRWPGFIDFVSKIPDESRFEEMILPHISVPVDKENPDFLFMRVVGRNAEGVVTCYYELLDEYDMSHGFSAMQRTTGFTTAVIARWIAQGRLNRGVLTPEFAIPSELINEFLGDLNSSYFDIKLRFQ